jgi:hypothetical protein
MGKHLDVLFGKKLLDFLGVHQSVVPVKHPIPRDKVRNFLGGDLSETSLGSNDKICVHRGAQGNVAGVDHILAVGKERTICPCSKRRLC